MHNINHHATIPDPVCSIYPLYIANNGFPNLDHEIRIQNQIFLSISQYYRYYSNMHPHHFQQPTHYPHDYQVREPHEEVYDDIYQDDIEKIAFQHQEHYQPPRQPQYERPRHYEQPYDHYYQERLPERIPQRVERVPIQPNSNKPIHRVPVHAQYEREVYEQVPSYHREALYDHKNRYYDERQNLPDYYNRYELYNPYKPQQAYLKPAKLEKPKTAYHDYRYYGQENRAYYPPPSTTKMSSSYYKPRTAQYGRTADYRTLDYPRTIDYRSAVDYQRDYTRSSLYGSRFY